MHRHVFVEYLDVSRPVEKNSLAVIVQGSIPFDAKRVAPTGSTPPADVVEKNVATVASGPYGSEPSVSVNSRLASVSEHAPDPVAEEDHLSRRQVRSPGFITRLYRSVESWNLAVLSSSFSSTTTSEGSSCSSGSSLMDSSRWRAPILPGLSDGSRDGCLEVARRAGAIGLISTTDNEFALGSSSSLAQGVRLRANHPPQLILVHVSLGFRTDSPHLPVLDALVWVVDGKVVDLRGR